MFSLLHNKVSLLNFSALLGTGCPPVPDLDGLPPKLNVIDRYALLCCVGVEGQLLCGSYPWNWHPQHHGDSPGGFSGFVPLNDPIGWIFLTTVSFIFTLCDFFRIRKGPLLPNLPRLVCIDAEMHNCITSRCFVFLPHFSSVHNLAS